VRRGVVRRSERVAEMQADRAAAKSIYREKEIDERVAHAQRIKQQRDELLGTTLSNPTGNESAEPLWGRWA
jgi:hypothetical protein